MRPARPRVYPPALACLVQLLFELKQYDEQAKKQSRGERSAGLVPPDTKLSIKLVPSRQDGCLYLTLQSNNEARNAAPSRPGGHVTPCGPVWPRVIPCGPVWPR
eukprot:2729423-Prymnesium_polylepis.1